VGNKGADDAIAAIQAAMKHTILATEVNLEFESVTVPDGGMLRRENTGDYTLTIRVHARDTSVKRTLVRGSW
jgi:hypothetical protein